MITLHLPEQAVAQIMEALAAQPLGKVFDTFILLRTQISQPQQPGPPPAQPEQPQPPAQPMPMPAPGVGNPDAPPPPPPPPPDAPVKAGGKHTKNAAFS